MLTCIYMHYVINIYHVVQELRTFSLNGNKRTDDGPTDSHDGDYSADLRVVQIIVVSAWILTITLSNALVNDITVCAYACLNSIKGMNTVGIVACEHQMCRPACTSVLSGHNFCIIIMLSRKFFVCKTCYLGKISVLHVIYHMTSRLGWNNAMQ